MQLLIYNCKIIPPPSVQLENITTHSFTTVQHIQSSTDYSWNTSHYFAMSRTSITDVTHTHTHKILNTYLYQTLKTQNNSKRDPIWRWHLAQKWWKFRNISVPQSSRKRLVCDITDNCAIHASCVHEVSERQTQNGSANGWVFATFKCQFKEHFLLDQKLTEKLQSSFFIFLFFYPFLLMGPVMPSSLGIPCKRAECSFKRAE